MPVNKRICRVCKKPTPLDECVRNFRAKDGRANICRPCQRVQNKAAYARSKMTYEEQQAAARLAGETQPCAQCGKETIGDAHRVWYSRTNGQQHKVYACITCWEQMPQTARHWLMWLVWLGQESMEADLNIIYYIGDDY